MREKKEEMVRMVRKGGKEKGRERRSGGGREAGESGGRKEKKEMKRGWGCGRR